MTTGTPKFLKSFVPNRPGFTLVELLIYITLISVLLVVITQIFISSLDVQLESESVSSVDQDGRYILSRLSYDIARADSLVIPASTGNPSAVLELQIGGVSYVYSKDGDRLILTRGGALSGQLTSALTKLESLSFEKVGNPSGIPTVRVSFGLVSEVVPETGPERESFQTTFGLR